MSGRTWAHNLFSIKAAESVPASVLDTQRQGDVTWICSSSVQSDERSGTIGEPKREVAPKFLLGVDQGCEYGRINSDMKQARRNRV